MKSSKVSTVINAKQLEVIESITWLEPMLIDVIENAKPDQQGFQVELDEDDILDLKNAIEFYLTCGIEAKCDKKEALVLLEQVQKIS